MEAAVRPDGAIFDLIRRGGGDSLGQGGLKLVMVVGMHGGKELLLRSSETAGINSQAPADMVVKVPLSVAEVQPPDPHASGAQG